MAEDFTLCMSQGTQVVGTGVVFACSESVPVDYVVRFPSGDEDRRRSAFVDLPPVSHPENEDK
jgi:hypothetical protein